MTVQPGPSLGNGSSNMKKSIGKRRGLVIKMIGSGFGIL